MQNDNYGSFPCVSIVGTGIANAVPVETKICLNSLLSRIALRLALTALLWLPCAAHAVSLEWDRNSETNVIGYRVYFGQSSRSYDSVLDANNETMLSLPPLQSGRTYYFAVTAYNNDGLESDFSDEVSYSEPAVNHPPVASDDSYSVLQNTLLNVTSGSGVLGNDSDPDGDPLTVVLVSPPAHGTLSLESSGAFSYSPAANFIGPDSFTYQCSDATASSSFATVRITVTDTPPPPNNVPIARADSYQMLRNTTLNVSSTATGVLGNDSDADGDPLTAILVSATTHGTVNLSSSGVFTYAPFAGFVGTDAFTYRCNDGKALSVIATVTISVTNVPPPPNQIPTAQADNYQTFQNTPLTVLNAGVLANDHDGNGDVLAAVLVQSTAHGALNLATNGTFTYLPQTDFVGTDVFTYCSTDGKATSDVATVTITIFAAEQPPVCPECLAALEQLVTARGGSWSTILSSAKVPENSTCLESQVIQFYTVARALAKLSDTQINEAIDAASACLTANLENELQKKQARVGTLLESKWSALASKRTGAISNQLQESTSLANMSARAKQLMKAAASLRRTEQLIASGQIAPVTLSNQVFWCRFSESGHSVQRVITCIPNGMFTLQDMTGSVITTESYVYERTAFDSANLTVWLDQSVSLVLRFGPRRGKISGDMRGWFTVP